MGTCASNPSMTAAEKEAKKRSNELEKKIQNDKQAEQRVLKLLLLGAGESGKSTLLKQMISIHGKGFDEADRKKYVDVIHSNVLLAIKTLCEQSDVQAQAFDTRVSPELKASKDYITELPMDAAVTPEVADHIEKLWRDPGIQRTLLQRSHFQLFDSAEYFFERLGELSAPEYLPSEQDLLRARVRTTGIVEQEFKISGNVFRMFDVGGQRNERKKWIHCFDEVTSVLFVVALSEYDQTLYEDEKVNRMAEAAELFKSTINSKWFCNTPIILFLNKKDIFEKKVKSGISIKIFFDDYNKSEDNVEDSMMHILDFFLSFNQSPKPRTIYHHFTCATDRNQMVFVFNSVRDCIIRDSLAEGGLLS